MGYLGIIHFCKIDSSGPLWQSAGRNLRLTASLIQSIQEGVLFIKRSCVGSHTYICLFVCLAHLPMTGGSSMVMP